MGKLDGKVVFITGAARGQGRSHAVRFAQEGADIIGLDVCDQIDTVPYPMASKEDLAETERLVTATGRRMIARQADVRAPDQIREVLAEGVAEFNRLDCVSANAGIFQFGEPGRASHAFSDAVAVMLTGVYHTLDAAIGLMVEAGNGGSIAITSSNAGLRGPNMALSDLTAGFLGYTAAKHGVVGLMRMYANSLAQHHIRVNTVHPTGVRTPMIENDAFDAWVGSVQWQGNAMGNAMPVDAIEAMDISHALLWLFSDEARYVTGVTLPVDAGSTNYT
ncbi:mycofactocin-coupled SDR family oxidoreductase [Gordonia sp. NPDC003424]